MCGRYFVLDSEDVLFTSEKKYWSLCCSVRSLITVGPSPPSPRPAALSWRKDARGLGGTLHAPAQAAAIGRASSWPLLCSAVLRWRWPRVWGHSLLGEADPRAPGKEAWFLPAEELSGGTQATVRCDVFLEGDWVGIYLIPSGQDFAFQNSPLLSCLKSRGSRL